MSSSQAPEAQTSIAPTTTWIRRLIITLTILAWIALAFVLLWIVGRIAQALLLLLIGALLAYMLYPLVHFLQHIMPRFLAVILVYLIFFTGISILLYIASKVILAQATALLSYVQSLINSGAPNKSQLQSILDIFQRLGISQAQLQSSAQQLLNHVQSIITNIFFVISNVFTILLNTFLVAMLSIYFLFSGPKLIQWLRKKTPFPQREQINFILDNLQRVVGGYVRGTITLATIFSVLTGIGVALIGVPYPFLLAVLAFLLEFIPFVGVYITGAVILILALTQSWIIALLAPGLFILLQNLENNVLSPRIVGGAIGINPIVNIFAVIAGAQLFGIAGALFAAPTAGFIQTLLQSGWQWWQRNHPGQFPNEQPEPEHS